MFHDPFEQRIFGPEGWTAPLAAALDGFVLPGADDGIREFAGVPAPLARTVAEALVHHGATGPELADPAVLLAVLDVVGPDATVCGRLFDPSRNDERVELTEVQLDVTGWDQGRLDDVAVALKPWGLTAVLEQLPSALRLHVGL